MTSATDDEVIAVYKKLTGNDEIEIVKDSNDDLNVNVTEPGEFIVKLDNGTELSGDDEIELDFEDDIDLEDDDEETIYEVELDEMVDIDGQKAPTDKKTSGDNLKGGFDSKTPHAKAEGPIVMHEDDGEYEGEEEEVNEQIPVGTAQARRMPGKAKIGQPRGAGAKQVKESKQVRNTLVNEVTGKFKTLVTEAKELKGKNEEYKKALKEFRTMLAETVVFNSNLTYVTKLFMEHPTTKGEKQQILKRFDEEVSTLKESKALYKSIVNELSSKKTMTESLDKTMTSSQSKETNVVNEKTAYINEETQRIKDLISRVEKR